ncbi:hypothetical protein GCM10018790_47920 [Kitasatospora xanthocidica]|uniref:hypothetical protein n=1 Tax=Kitasatospora xanthocidica TaxID=83382 RepID=UPI00167BC8C4|nr:hypothetical protein [Kitasatospora xanthocidica]GHF64535.1 hypothetical protein GCM10018790_47920 [Kitasatospora xanthocidica]
MDADEANEALDQARRSYATAAQPPLPGWAPALCGLLVAGAITLDGLAPDDTWLRLAAIAGGAALGLLALGLLRNLRLRQGIRGLRGPARKAQTELFSVGLVFIVLGLGAFPGGRLIYAGIGVFAGAFAWWKLQTKAGR